VDYVNFFESQKEAVMRLMRTVVLYDGQPVEILAVTDHISDGHLRAYIRPIGLTEEEFRAQKQPPVGNTIPSDHPAAGEFMDKWLEENPSSGVMRKHLSSPLFNKFRPFELGMCNVAPYTYYVERQPNRKSEQGLIKTMLHVRKLSTESPEEGENGYNDVGMYGPEFKACILGQHPTPQRCLEGLSDPRYANRSAAFHRDFALVKGPIDSLFLAYKASIIGSLPHGDFSKVKIGEQFRYTREVVDELKLFNSIQ
jgi:hypothetical protein